MTEWIIAPHRKARMLSKRWQYVLGFYIVFLLVVFRLALISPVQRPADDDKPIAAAAQRPDARAEDWLGSLLDRRGQVSLTSNLQHLLRQLTPARAESGTSPSATSGLKPPTLNNLGSYLSQLFSWAQ